MNAFCTNHWHQDQTEDYCTSCGERKDGRTSLASTQLGLLILGVYARYENQPAVKLRFVGTTKEGSDFVCASGELISVKVNDFHKWMIMDYCLPFQVIPMSLDKDGCGPEMDSSKVAKTVYEIWDAVCQTVGVFDNHHDAKLHLMKLG